MSSGGYTHTTRATGTVLTAAIYNSDHQNHILNQNPQMTGGYSDTVTQMQLLSDPGVLGAENLATTLALEIEHLRYQIKSITGENQWYIAPIQNLKSISGIGDNSVPLTKLSNTTQGKLMGRVSAGVGPWQEFDIPGLSALVPAAGDFVLGVPAAGGAPRKIAVSNIAAQIILPQGRLTLTASTPCMVANVSGGNTVRYTPYNGINVPVYNGTAVVIASTGGELTQLTTDNTKSPAAAATNSNYDIFFWMDGSTPRISRGPAWSSATARGTGAGTTEITRIQGLWVNAQTIVNGPAAQRGTYLGTIRTNASALIDFVHSVAGGQANIGVWNQYNRVKLTAVQRTVEADYSLTNQAVRPVRGNSLNSIQFVRGNDEDTIHAILTMRCVVGSTTFYIASIGFDNTTAAGGTGSIATTAIYELQGTQTAAPGGTINANLSVFSALGFHTLYALENSSGTQANIFLSGWYGLLMDTMY